MTQPNALRLADALDSYGTPQDVSEQAAAELRRLQAENERCRDICAATSEAWRQDVKWWRVERDALLEVLKAIVAMWDHHCDAHGDGTPSPLHVKARAVIAKAEENA